MVKINGVSATKSFELKKQNVIKPTIKEILDRMENNYQNINNINIQNYNQDNVTKNKINDTYKSDFSNANNQNSNAGIFSSLSNIINPNKSPSLPNENPSNDNLLLSILPMMLSKNKGVSTLKNSENMIFKEILKNSNNPRLMQIAELLPKILNRKSVESETSENETSNTPSIETYTKTTDFKE